MRIADVINYLRFGSLREVSIAKNALCNQEALQVIVNAINMLRIETKPINCNSVAVVSGCSINTVRKYKDMIDNQ